MQRQGITGSGRSNELNMPGIVRIDSDRFSYARRYKAKDNLRDIIKWIVRKFNATNYTINIRPDVDEETGEDIKHHRRPVYSANNCAPCVVLQESTIVGIGFKSAGRSLPTGY